MEKRCPELLTGTRSTQWVTSSLIAIIAAVLITALASVNAVGADRVHHYSVAVNASLSRLEVVATFSEPVDRISARSRHAGRFLLDANNCAEDVALRQRSRRMLLPAAGIRCLSYAVDLREAAAEYRGASNLHSQNIVASPSYWLWRPALVDGTELRVEFELPDGIQVSVPWQQTDASKYRYTLATSPESAHAPAVFGKFDYREIDIPGATLRLTQLTGRSTADNAAAVRDAISNWIRATATDVSLTYGKFPNPSPQVVIMPVSSSRGSVAFGRVVRDGGETVELLVDPSGDIAEFFSDWTATHEFSHMLLPYLDSDYHWVSEGFSQYYQNILLTRSGEYDALRMWQNLHDGFERGRLSQPALSPNEAAARSGRGSRMKVYWSGAALALMADVTLRERSGGTETLDQVLERLQECCLPSPKTWSGPEFFAKLDTLTSEPVFMTLYEQYADTAGFPDTSDLYARLGLEIVGGKVRVERSAELVSVRDAMTRTDPSDARWREELAAN